MYIPSRQIHLIARIAKWGNSLAIRIPRAFAAEMGLEEGDEVTLTLSEGRLVLTPKPADYSLDELAAGITPENRHTETDWGEPAGSEVW